MHRAAQVAELAASKDKVVAHYAAQERQAAEEAQLQKDAARYRWLRDQATEGDLYSLSIYQGAVFDTAIDQEIAARRKK